MRLFFLLMEKGAVRHFLGNKPGYLRIPVEKRNDISSG